MMLRGLFAGALALALLSVPAAAQETKGTQPLSIAKGGTAAGTAATAFANLVQPPSATTLGGVKSLTCSASNWFNTLSTLGVFGCSQPNFTDLAGSIAAGQIPASVISYAKIQNVTSARLLGNPTGGAAAPSEISLGATLAFSGSALQTSAFTGDVTASANSFATTIGNAAVTYAKIQNVTASRLLGNPTGGAAAPSEISLPASLAFNGSALRTAAFTGDVTTAVDSFATTIAANAVTNAKMATMAAYTWKCNNTAGSAVPTDCDTTAFTLKASPVAADIVLIQDSAAANAYKRTTVSALAAAGSVGSLNGQTGALVSYFEPQGRLTLATATPVMTTTQSAKTTIFYTPYHGNMVPIYDGANMVPTVVAEISVATTDTAKNPAAIGASKVNDWFIWNDAGTIRISHGPDWTNDTTRSAGTALVMVNGIQLNNASITNGPAASRGTYVGTTRSNGSSQLDFIFGASNTAAFFGVWNTYNRVIAGSNISLTGDSHNYLSATIRQASANALWQATFVVGAVEDAATVNLVTQVNTAAAAGAVGYAGASLNSTSTFTHGRNFVQAATAAVTQMSTTHSAQMVPALGVNVISANEASDGTNSNGFNANSVNVLSTSLRL